jgi:flagellar biosynthetic protein FliP
MTFCLAKEGHGSPEAKTGRIRHVRRTSLVLATLIGAITVLFGLSLGFGAGSASAATPTHSVVVRSHTALSEAHAVNSPTPPTKPSSPAAPTVQGNQVTVDVGGKPSQSITILLLVTVLSVAPSLLLLVTSFTKIFVVLSLTRNALGLNNVPPNQVLSGLSLFLSLFIMGPVLEKVNKVGIQPYLNGTKDRSHAWHDGVTPLRDFMLSHTRSEEIALMLRAGHLPNPADKADLQLTTIIPAFVLSELRAAMIIGFVIYIPFVIIDLVVSSSLMSLGMMMLPPVSVALPFKMLLFVLVDGWGLIITNLVQSYHTGGGG